ALVPFRNHLSNFHRRAFAQIVNVRFECQAKAGNFQLTGAFSGVSQAIRYRGFDLIEHPMRLAVVHFARGADQASLIWILRHNKPRVDGDTVAAHARTWLENVHTRVTIRETNQLPDVNPLIGTNQRQFIRESNVDVAEAVFRQLAHFSGAGVGNHAFAFQENLIQLAGARGADRCHTANHAIVFNQFDHHLARQHTLRAVGDINISLFTRLLREAEIRTRFGQPLGHLFSRADRRSGFKDDQRPFLQHRRNGFCCRFNIRHIGFMVAFEWRRDGNQVSVSLYRRGAGSQVSTVHSRFNHAVEIRLHNMNFATVDGFHRPRVDVYAYNLLLTRGEGRRSRQPDIAKTHDRDGSKTHSDTRLCLSACKIRPQACPSP